MLEGAPPSIERDFYIWRYLKQEDITPNQAKQAYEMLHKSSFKHFLLYAKRSDNKDVLHRYECSKTDMRKLLTSKDKDCLRESFKIKTLLEMDKKELEAVMKRFLPKEKEHKIAKIIASKDPFFRATKRGG